MRLTSYKPQKLARKSLTGNLRDAKLVVIATEDTYAGKQYFESKLFQSNRIKIEVIPTPNAEDKKEKTKSSPRAVEDRLRNFIDKYELLEDDILCIMIDRDHWGNKMLSEISQKTFRKKRRNIIFAVSNPCFELWLFLHVSEWDSNITTITSKEMERKLREKLGSYNKKNINVDCFQGHILEACSRAERMDKQPQDRWPQSIGTHISRLINILKDFCSLE